MQIKKTIVRTLSGIFLLIAGLCAASLMTSRFEITEHGAHKNVMVSLGPLGYAKVGAYAGTGDRPAMPGFLDGPVIRLAGDGAWTATWFCEDAVKRRAGKEAQLRIDCAGKTHVFDLAPPAGIAPAVVAMPAKLLVLSDIEGNAAFLDAALRHLGVVDADGNWGYGANRVVIAGDSVDRGRDVFAVLWRLHALSRQAGAAGGGLHMILGNHEQYLLRGNPSRAHSEHLVALEQMGGQAQAFAADTVLGKWLREQPVIVKAGRVLFTHGGISADVAGTGLSLDQLNDGMRRYWRGQPATKAELDSVIGQGGVSQYRGYFDGIEGLYAKATDADVAKMLQGFDADSIVVGHTQVERISTLFGGRVHAVDVNTNEAADQALLFENGVATVVDVGTDRLLPAPRARVTRPLDLASGDDWRSIGSIIRRSYQIASLPHPY